MDREFESTLLAIKNKEPRVYNGEASFYSKMSQPPQRNSNPEIDRIPMRLSDYHQKTLLKNSNGVADTLPSSRSQQQEELQARTLQEIREAGEDSATDSDPAGHLGKGTAFLVKRLSPGETSAKQQRGTTVTRRDVDEADQNPEAFLSKFLSSRAWVSTAPNRLKVFESDDEDDDLRAEEFEVAYNLRFEDPEKANRKLMFHSRTAAADTSVRMDSASKRKRARQEARSRRGLDRMESTQERQRLRKLKMEELADKVAEVEAAAGSSGTVVSLEEWSRFLNEDWDDKQWEEFMRHKFDENYYTSLEADSCTAEDDGNPHIRKKPRWDNDIDVSDLVRRSPLDRDASPITAFEKPADPIARTVQAGLRQATAQRPRKEDPQRQKLEQLVEQKLTAELAVGAATARHGRFRYRETSPTTYGLTARDILLASDAQLNQYVGLKRLAAFRDPVSKKKDKKRLGKKARLRQWRLETFGTVS